MCSCSYVVSVFFFLVAAGHVGVYVEAPPSSKDTGKPSHATHRALVVTSAAQAVDPGRPVIPKDNERPPHRRSFIFNDATTLKTVSTMSTTTTIATVPSVAAGPSGTTATTSLRRIVSQPIVNKMKTKLTEERELRKKKKIMENSPHQCV